MKRTALYLSWSLLWCALLVAGGQFLANAKSPDDEAPVKAKCPVAVLDVSRIFKEHKAFKEQVMQMKGEVDAAEKNLREERDKIKELADEFQALEAGTPLKDKLEVELAERSSQLKLKMNLQKNEFMKREAVIYAEVYKGIESIVAAYSRERDISLVLRFNDVEMKESDRESILASVNKAVVFHDGLDITDEILKRLNSPVEGADL